MVAMVVYGTRNDQKLEYSFQCISMPYDKGHDKEKENKKKKTNLSLLTNNNNYSMAARRQQFDNILKDFSNIDKDLRYMALNDLEEILTGADNVQLDAETEKKICTGITVLLDDKSPVVQGRAISTLTALITKITKPSLSQILNKLIEQVVGANKSAEERDIAALGLGNVIRSVDESHGAVVVQSLSTPLVKALSAANGLAQTEALSNLDQLLKRFGRFMSKDYSAISRAVLPCLVIESSKKKSTTRESSIKPAISCLANFARVIPDDLFTDLVQKLIERSSKTADAQQKRIYIQSIGAIGRSVGHRLGKFMDNVVPLISDSINDNRFESDIELKDNCLRTFASLVSQCPQEISTHIQDLLDMALSYLAYDPNLVSDGDEPMDDVGSADDGDAWGDDGDGGDDWGSAGDDGWGSGDDGVLDDVWDDPDDQSWQVRKACAQLLAAIISTRPDLLGSIYKNAAPALVKQFGDSENSVRQEMMVAFGALIKQTESATNHVEAYHALNDQVMEALIDVLEHKRIVDNVRIGVYQLLSEITNVIDDALSEDQIGKFVDIIIAQFKAKVQLSPAVASAMLEFIRSVISSHKPETIHPFFSNLVKVSYAVLRDKQLKQLSSSALSTLKCLIGIMKPPSCTTTVSMSGGGASSSSSSSSPSSSSSSSSPSSSSSSSSPSSYANFKYDEDLPRIAKAILRKVKATDIDQEVKEVAIDAAGALLSVAGTEMSESEQLISLLVNTHLSNEITRLAAVKALRAVIRANPVVPLSESLVSTGLLIMSSLLRKNSRPLRLETLQTLIALYNNESYTQKHQKVVVEHAPTVLKEAAGLIDIRDLQLCDLALRLSVASVKVDQKKSSKKASSLTSVAKKSTFPQALKLVESPLLQGSALHSLIEVFTLLVHSSAVSSDALLNQFISIGEKIAGNSLKKQTLLSVSSCIAAITITISSKSKRAGVITKFVDNVSKSDATNTLVLLSLLSIGEIGRKKGKFVVSTTPNIDSVLVKCFASAANEEHKSAAAHALGLIAFGAPKSFLPKVVKMVETDEKHRYLMLQALREIVNSALAQISSGQTLNDAVSAQLDGIPSLLFKLSSAQEEGTRNSVAECLGRLAVIQHSGAGDPPATTLLHRFIEILNGSKDASTSDVSDEQGKLVRSTIITAVKYTIVEQAHPIDSQLVKEMSEFLQPLKDTDLAVKRSALLMLTYAAHNKPHLIQGELDWVQKVLYDNTPKNKEHVRLVVFGPFQHPIDDGLPCRKATFECMHTLLDHCIPQLDLQKYTECLVHGLADEYDIKMLCHLKLGRLAAAPAAHIALVKTLPQLIPPLRETVTKENRDTDVKQDRDRNEEEIRSALKAIAAITRKVPQAQLCVPFREFLTNEIRKGALCEQFTLIYENAESPNATTTSSSSSSSSSSSYAASSTTTTTH
eukprot:CAMPEP_0201560916 /NCGR_PEP_ID=MMETSP0173_2-20130828/78515_1 /ASSEMBLY_ACC=CAM_ASM_000268 /TAXON_ID=218659 /ORGANISM="Vexillifera sp., Strain DIVA3 564/2" /LENGTH=1415 /DNA_ID=CAMNT_0047975381 /DNA_START=79 /DNA_END=4326 /DNA_ORIENTATION=+